LQGQNAVNSTLLQVLKVFYRPQALRGQDPLGAPLRLRWTIKARKGSDYVLRLENPGPFHIVFAGLALLGSDDKGAVLVASDSEFQVLDPMASVDVVLRASGIDAPVRQLVFSTVNDFGMTEVFSGDVVNGAIAGVERVRAVSSRPDEPGPSGVDPVVSPPAPPRRPASTARAALG
jgi:P pilus assembly chaperone PapD